MSDSDEVFINEVLQALGSAEEIRTYEGLQNHLFKNYSSTVLNNTERFEDNLIICNSEQYGRMPDSFITVHEGKRIEYSSGNKISRYDSTIVIIKDNICPESKIDHPVMRAVFFADKNDKNVLNVPDFIKAHPPRTAMILDGIKKIGDGAFKGCMALEKVEISPDVEEIGKKAFMYCVSLSTIKIPGTVRNIDDCAFMWCQRLDNVILSPGLERIGRRAFAWCIPFHTIEIPGSVKNIDEEAFLECVNLEKATLSPGVKRIGRRAFAWCVSIPRIRIPGSVDDVGDGAFKNCKGLNKAIITPGVKTIGIEAFAYCLSLTSTAIPGSIRNIGPHAFSYCIRLDDITISPGVVRIGHAAFEGCESISSITIPDTVRFINSGAFIWCKKLNKIVMGTGVKAIGDESFEGCESLPSITIPDTVKTIGSRAFAWCKELNTITMRDGLRNIGDESFEGCESLPSITIPDTVKTIGEGAFSGCVRLRSIHLSNQVMKIGDNAFSQCDSLRQILVGKENTVYESENDALYSKTDKCLIKCPQYDTLDFYVKPGTKKITEGSFSGCNSLKTIHIPESVESIDDYFVNCYDLQSIEVDENNNHYTSVDGILYSKDMKILIKIPPKNYQTNFNSNVEIVSAFAAMNCNYLENVTLLDVKNIDGYAFSNCTNLKRAVIGEKIEDIGWRAFFKSGIVDATIMGPAEIWNEAFSHCHNLQNAIFNEVEVIHDSAFSYCINLETVRCCNIVEVESLAFLYCKKLKDISIPNVETIGHGAFENCTSLHSLGYIKDDVKLYVGQFYNSKIFQQLHGMKIDDDFVTSSKFRFPEWFHSEMLWREILKNASGHYLSTVYDEHRMNHHEIKKKASQSEKPTKRITKQQQIMPYIPTSAYDVLLNYYVRYENTLHCIEIYSIEVDEILRMDFDYENGKITSLICPINISVVGGRKIKKIVTNDCCNIGFIRNIPKKLLSDTVILDVLKKDETTEKHCYYMDVKELELLIEEDIRINKLILVDNEPYRALESGTYVIRKIGNYEISIRKIDQKPNMPSTKLKDNK